MNYRTGLRLPFLCFLLVSSLSAFANEASVQEASREVSAPSAQTKTTLFEKIRNDSDSVEYFSLPLFPEFLEEDLGLYKYPNENLRGCVHYSVTFEIFQSYDAIYEVAKRASRAEIVECLSAFDELSPKGRAFVLASTVLYICRSENPKFGEKESLRPLSPDEKSVFLQIVQKCLENGSMVFELTDQMDEEQKLKRLMEIVTSENYSNSQLMEWRKTFREEAFAFQRELGDQNPFYPLSPRTEKMWRQVCDESPIAVVYTILAMETRLDFDAIDLPLRNSGFQKSSSAPEDNATDRSVSQGIKSSKTDAMRRYLHLQVALQAWESSIMGPYIGDHQGIPEPLKEIKPLRLSDIAREVVALFPEMKEGKIPRFSEKNDAARAL